MSYQDRYQEWLHSPALSAAEKAELESIQNDPKEIESRFFDQLSFGTAGLRGTMGVGLYRMNVHVIRHATPVAYTHLQMGRLHLKGPVLPLHLAPPCLQRDVGRS